MRPILLSVAVACVLTAVSAAAELPAVCGQLDAVARFDAPLPPAVDQYLSSGTNRPFDLRAVCAAWAGLLTDRHSRPDAVSLVPSVRASARFIVFPRAGLRPATLAKQLRRGLQADIVSVTSHVVVVDFGLGRSTTEVRDLVTGSAIAYAEPDCDGPDFATTSAAMDTLGEQPQLVDSCWSRAAGSSFPNDPCISDLWGHTSIGWNPDVAAASRSRLVAVLDSGVDVRHEDLAAAIWRPARRARPSAALLAAECPSDTGCYPHGTQMAGTIAGQMNNAVGVAGVAPNSKVLPLLITKIEHGNLMRLSTIAAAIDSAAMAQADIINVSAKWPVDSRAVGEAIRRATGGPSNARRLLVTGYATSFDAQDRVREGYPSRYRCLPGVIAAVPGDMRAESLRSEAYSPAVPADGRIMAPGVDIVVTTTDNAEGRYAMVESAGASSAAAYVSGAAALVWGTRPLDRCGAADVKRLLFCRGRQTQGSKYPWINVEFLNEVAALPNDASCRDALAALGCGS